MLTEQQNFAVVRTELDRVFYQNFEYDASFPSIATANTADLFKPMNITNAAYIEQIFKGSSLFPVIGEIGTVPSFTPQAANKMTTFVRDFAQGVDLSKNWFDDNMHGMYERIVADLGLKARVTMDANAFALFRGAFTTTLTADGVAFISASHVLLSGSTYSNIVSGALSPTTLNDGIVKLRQQVDQAGVVLGNVPAILLVPSALFKKAIEYTDSELIPDSANNNVNVYKSAYGIKVYTSPYLDAVAGGSDTAWFLLAKNHCVTRIIRQGVQTFLRDWGFSNNRSYFYQVNFRETVYVPDYIGAVGSTG